MENSKLLLWIEIGCFYSRFLFNQINRPHLSTYHSQPLSKAVEPTPCPSIALYAVAYFGGSKDEIEMKHMANREKLLREGVVTREEYDEAVEKMK